MIKYLFICLSFFAVTTAAQPSGSNWSPENRSLWQHKTNSARHAAVFGGQVYNFRTPAGEWQSIDNNWLRNDDSMFTSHNALLKTTVYRDGRTILIPNDDTIKLQLHSLAFLDENDHRLITIGSQPHWSLPGIDENKIFWNDVFPDVDYAIIKTNGKIEQRLYFNPGFLDTVINKYQALPDNQEYCLANLIEYSFYDSDDKTFLTENHIQSLFSQESQHLYYPGWENHPLIPVNKNWLSLDNQLFCLETVSMRDIIRIHNQYPDAALFHNDAYTFTAADGADTYVQNGATANTNFGTTNSTLKCSQSGDLSSGQETGGFLFFDLSSIPSNVHIDSSILHLYFGNAADSCFLERMLTPWDEGNQNAGIIDAADEFGATWNFARDSLGTLADWQWQSSTFSASDVDNNNGSFYGQLNSTAYHAYCYNGAESSGNNSQLLSDWINGIIPNYGYSLRDTDTISITTYRPFEFPVSSIQPWLYLEWTVLEQTAPEKLRRRKIILTGDRP